MSAIEWRTARPSVIEAVALAAPRTSQDAKALLCAAVAFLNSPCGWDRVDPPSLANLLTEAAAEIFARSDAKNSRSLAVYASSLRALVRARGGQTRTARAVDSAVPETTPAMQVAAATAGVSTVALVLACERVSRGPVTRSTLSRVRAATVTHDRAGTVGPDHSSAGALLAAEHRYFAQEVVTTATPPRPTTSPSARQQLAMARADRAAAARALSGPRLAESPDLSTLRPGVARALTAYRPQTIDPGVWVHLRSLAVRLVAGAAPVSDVAARNGLTIVSQFLVWVWAQPGRPDPEAAPTAAELLGSTLVDRYVTGARSGLRAAGAPDATISTVRSVLRRAVNSLDADYAPSSIPAATMAPPYDPAQCDLFVEIAQSQPNSTKTRNACFLIGLCLGAGLSPSDLRYVRYCDIREVHHPALGHYLTVHVPEGIRRTVVIRRTHEALVRRALSLQGNADSTQPVLGTSTTRRNVTQAALRSIVTAGAGRRLDIDPRRLRTTWLFAALNAPVPLAVVLEQAGLTSARTITDLLALCPSPDPAEVARAMVALTDGRMHLGEPRTDER
ncbi:hypothetical protein [Cellulomonas sp. URHD0024]|uniref:hypothetical protein n=1 Tax=Cellulomonas sp. URHD0024 TaxID=1302620 RepID=UPI000484CEAD|nr:hypothetical protein [Cellulomonas sp. URHD0024]